MVKCTRAEKIFRSLYPHYRHRWEVYNDALRREITGDTVWLDIGCGTNDNVAEFGGAARRSLGIDVIDYPQRVDAPFLQADLRHIPLPNGFANLITMRMVVEHLEKVPEDFSEIDRLLSAGGHVLILTTNTWSPVVFLPRLLPFTFKRRIIRKLFGISDIEIFPTYHRCNTPRRISEGVPDLTMSSLEFIEEVPFNSSFLTIIFGLWYSLVRHRALRYLRSNLLATYHKPVRIAQ
jgi:ubiquinone/menaquinone biosynthesis C-methylase UbiE